MRWIGALLAGVLGWAGPGWSAEEAESRGGAPPPPAEAVVADLPMLEGYPTRVMVDLAPEGQNGKDLMVARDLGGKERELVAISGDLKNQGDAPD